MNCIGCDLASEVWYEPWGGFGARPGEPISGYTPAPEGIAIVALIAVAFAAWVLIK